MSCPEQDSVVWYEVAAVVGRGDISAAADLVNAIAAYQSLGHTCGIHTSSDASIERLALATRTARVLVNQNLNEGAGSPRNGLPFTLSLSCDTWAATSPPRM